jgi:hypothetical protein
MLAGVRLGAGFRKGRFAAVPLPLLSGLHEFWIAPEKRALCV